MGQGIGARARGAAVARRASARAATTGLLAGALAAGAVLAGCGARDAVPASAPFPRDFRPGPTLGSPPEPAPDALGAGYLDRISPRFERPWRAFLDDLRLRLPPGHALNRAGLTAVLELELDADGGLIALRVATPSGQPAFDEAAREVASEAVPLPPPPAELVSDTQRLYLAWRFSRDVRQAGAATARIRRIEWPIERAVPPLVARGRIAEAARRIAAAAEGAAESGRAAILAGFRGVCAATVVQALISDDGARVAIGVAAVVDARLVAGAADLRRLARGSIDPAVRRAALRALGQIGDRAAAPVLRDVAMKEGPQAAEQIGAAAASLGELGLDGEVRAVAASRLRSPNELDRWMALVVLSQLAAPEMTAELEGILRGDGHAEPAERVTAAAALGAIASGAAASPAAGRAAEEEPARRALAALTECLGSPEGSLRAACAEAIAGAAAAGMRSRPAATRLLRLFGDRDEGARAAAVLAAARLDPARFAARSGALGRERSELVLVALARGLAGAPGPRAVPRLVRMADSAIPSVRLAAATALAGRPEPRAARALAQLVEHRDPAVRAVAMRGLRDPEALRTAMRGDAPEVGAAAMAALVALEGPWASLPDAAELLAEQAPGSAEQALVARAWLVR